MKKENFILYDEGDVKQNIQSQLHKGFRKENVKKILTTQKKLPTKYLNVPFNTCSSALNSLNKSSFSIDFK